MSIIKNVVLKKSEKISYIDYKRKQKNINESKSRRGVRFTRETIL